MHSYNEFVMKVSSMGRNGHDRRRRGFTLCRGVVLWIDPECSSRGYRGKYGERQFLALVHPFSQTAGIGHFLWNQSIMSARVRSYSWSMSSLKPRRATYRCHRPVESVICITSRLASLTHPWVPVDFCKNRLNMIGRSSHVEMTLRPPGGVQIPRK